MLAELSKFGISVTGLTPITLLQSLPYYNKFSVTNKTL
jgi:hypothetical protein